MRAKAIGLAVVAAFLARAAYAQHGIFKGKVVDADGKPLEKVEVLIQPQTSARAMRIATRANGEFLKLELPSGRYKVTFTLDTYVPNILEFAVSGTDTVDAGKVILDKVPVGAITEKTREEAQKHLDAAMAGSNQQDFQKTIESLKKFLELVPNSPEAHFNIAAAYEKAGDKDNALTYYQKATELKPDMYDAYVAMADIYGSGKQYKEGIAMLQKAVAIKATSPTVLFNLGAYAVNAGDMAAAQQAFEKLTDVDPKNAAAHYQLAMIAINQSKPEDAVGHLEKYLELDPLGANAAAAKQLLDTLKKK